MLSLTDARAKLPANEVNIVEYLALDARECAECSKIQETSNDNNSVGIIEQIARQ